MTVFTLYEGRDSNDNDRVTNFRKKGQALQAFKKSKYAYAVVHQYDVNESGDNDYKDTIAEKQEVA